MFARACVYPTPGIGLLRGVLAHTALIASYLVIVACLEYLSVTDEIDTKMTSDEGTVFVGTMTGSIIAHIVSIAFASWMLLDPTWEVANARGAGMVYLVLLVLSGLSLGNAQSLERRALK